MIPRSLFPLRPAASWSLASTLGFLIAMSAGCGASPTTAASAPGEPAPGTADSTSASSSATDSRATPADVAANPSATPDAPPPEPAVQARGCPEPKDRSRVQIAAADVQELVSANKNHLHAACWKPAIAKNPKGPDKVRVATEVQIEPDGRVKEVRIVGGNDYADFAPCLEKELRLWCFPGAKQPSSLMFPMVFVKAEGEMMAVPASSGKR